jgi:hypothetical protein
VAAAEDLDIVSQEALAVLEVAAAGQLAVMLVVVV